LGAALPVAEAAAAVAADRRARMPAVRESMVGSCLCRRFLDFALLLSASRRQSSSSTFFAGLLFQRVDDAASDRKTVGGQTGFLHIVVFGRGESMGKKGESLREADRLGGSRTEDNNQDTPPAFGTERERVKGETDCNRSGCIVRPRETKSDTVGCKGNKRVDSPFELNSRY